MFLVNDRYPPAKIREVEVKVHITPKTVWAILPNGQRKIIGCYVFQTEAAAQRCQLALAEKIVKRNYHSYETANILAGCKEFVEKRVIH